MQKIAFYIFLLAGLSSCKAFKPVTDERANDKRQTSIGKNSSVSEDDASPVVKKRAKRNINYDINSPNSSTVTEKVSALQLKYNQLLEQDIETQLNEKLFSFIDDWWGTPYRIGGMTKSGVDCSGFVFTLYISIYKIELPRTALEQRDMCDRIKVSDLREGDLVFFHTTKRVVSHVGVYLGNNKFVHASTSNGVMISDLDEEYWSKRFLNAGRISQNN